MNYALTTDKPQINIFVDLCFGYGLRKVVISPGSRNAPLILAFCNNPEIECFVIPDERSAAYFALGVAQFTGQPVGMVCTSGTAALNYIPALAEAYHQQLQLVAITADRPPEWIGQLDGQTINQSGMYENFTVYQAQLPVEIHSGQEIWHIERMVRDGFNVLNKKRRPVHFNVPLREPLYQTEAKRDIAIQPLVSPISRQTIYLDSPILDDLKQYSKIMLIFGMQRPQSAFSDAVKELASRKDMVIVAEHLSNLSATGIFLTSDALFAALPGMNKDSLKPDLVISFGDMVLSKPLKQWVRSLPGIHRWVVTQTERIPDVFQGIDRVVDLDAESFVQGLSGNKVAGNSKFYADWEQAYEAVEGFQKDFTGDLPWSDMQVFKVLSDEIPDHSIVHLGNSSPVRYAQFFHWREGIRFYGNRGTSGIDGASSTAIGMANQTDDLVTLITGDVSFLYDSNALWNAYKKKNFKIIVVNNKGGNIFSLIGGPERTGLLGNYFATHIPVDLNYLCKAYGMHYHSASSETELRAGLPVFYADPACSLLEVHTDPDVNTRVWKEYFKTIKNKFQHE